MSPEEVEQLGRSFSAWDRGDKEAWLAASATSEIRSSGTFPGMRPSYRGHDALGEFWDALRAPWRSWATEVVRLEDFGERAVFLFRVKAEGEASGAAADLEWGYVITRTDGGFIFQNELSWEAALAAAR